MAPGFFQHPRDPAPEITDARYSKGQKLVRCPSVDGYKSRAARLAEHLKGRWTGREKGYVMSPTKAEKLLALFTSGRDASTITGDLYPLDEAKT